MNLIMTLFCVWAVLTCLGEKGEPRPLGNRKDYHQ